MKLEEGFIQLYPMQEPQTAEEKDITRDEYLHDVKSMQAMREEFVRDHNLLLALSIHGPMLVTLVLDCICDSSHSKSFSYRRLGYLDSRFHLHVMLNELREVKAQKGVPHRDFYNVRKVFIFLHSLNTARQKYLVREYIKIKFTQEFFHISRKKALTYSLYILCTLQCF